jgi:hypothetical protein
MYPDTDDYDSAREYKNDYPDSPVSCDCGFEGEMYDLDSMRKDKKR